MAEDKKYYLNVNEQNVGPLSFEDIVEKLKNGLLSPEDQIFQEGNQNWVQIKDIDELAEYRAQAPDNEQKIWFIRNNKQNIGPITKNDILSLLHNNEVDINDYVWRKGLGNWVPINDLYELKTTKDVAETIEKKTLEQMPRQIEEQIEQKSLELIRRNNVEEKQMQEPAGKPERTPKKLLPEFIFGIAIMLLGGYQIGNSLIMGGGLVILGAVLVMAYFISNRRKVIKDVSDRQ